MFSIQDLGLPAVAFGPSIQDASRPYDMPYTPFSKQEKIGRVADWVNAEEASGTRQGQQQRNVQGRYNRERQTEQSAAFGFQHEHDESSFATVDSTGRTNVAGTAAHPPVPAVVARSTGLSGFGGHRTGAANAGNARSNFFAIKRQDGQGNRQGGDRRQMTPRPQGAANNQRGSRGNGPGGFQQRTQREPSIAIPSEWNMIFEFELTKLAKTASLDPPIAETIDAYGQLAQYARQFDRVKSSSHIALQATERAKFINVTASADPVLTKIAKDRGDSSDVATVYAVDTILAQLMVSGRAVYSWDIIATRVGNSLYLDRRADVLDLQMVNENSVEPPPEAYEKDKDSSNSASTLGLEATYINTNFSQQVVDHAHVVPMSNEDSPFPTGESGEKSSSAFLYRKFAISEKTELVVRTELDAVVDLEGKTQNMIIRALNQVPGLPGPAQQDWKRALDQQRGAVVATELRNNSYKVAKWAIQAILADADWMKIGYVGRASPRDPSKHIIMGVSSHCPSDFAPQMNLSIAHAWGLLAYIVEILLRQPEGKYVLLKDPNKPSLLLYKLPLDHIPAKFICGQADPFAKHAI